MSNSMQGDGFAPLASDIENRFGMLAAVDTGADFQTALGRALTALDPFMKNESNVGFIVSVIVASARAEHRLCPHRLALMLGAETAKSIRRLSDVGHYAEAAAILKSVIDTQPPLAAISIRFFLDAYFLAPGAKGTA